jgi:hypothetical protein
MATLNFDPKIYIQAALDAFVANLAPMNAFARSYSPEAVSTGSAIHVPRVDAITATTFNQTYTGTGGTVGTITVTMDKHRITTVDLTDVQRLNTGLNPAVFARQQGKALAKLVMQDVWSLITTNNFGAAVLTTAGANYSKTSVRAFRKALADADVDMDMLSLFLGTTEYDALLSDANLSQAFQFGSNTPIRDAQIGRVLGFNVYESNIIPLNSISLIAFAAHPDSIAVAVRGFDAVVPDGKYEAFETVTDPESGLSMNYRLLYDDGTGKWHSSFECLFGYAVGLTPGLKLATKP